MLRVRETALAVFHSDLVQGVASHADIPSRMTPKHVPYVPYQPHASTLDAARGFLDIMRKRRSVRFFRDTPVDVEVIRACVEAASTAPSGAHKQPWRFVAISHPGIKKQLREAAEAEEREFYARRATPEWLADLAPLGTDASKPFLEIAPWVVVLFKLTKTDPDEQGNQGKVYYTDESVGIAAGMFITALHHAGLVTLTHTPSPMGFLGPLLGRPAHERPFLVLPVGYPAADCTVPDLKRKSLSEVLVER